MPATLPDEMRRHFTGSRDAIRARLEAFGAVPQSLYFYELCYCLCTPQSSARNAESAVQALIEQNFFVTPFNPESLLRRGSSYIRFHKTKAKRLLRAREQFPEIEREILSHTTNLQKRDWLVENVDGMSLKEASHFLRNIGFRELAILDRHILKHLMRCGVIRARPNTLTAKRYLSIERKFKRFAAAVDIPMDELDLLFWSAETGEILK